MVEMAYSIRKARIKEATFRRFLSFVLLTLFGAFLVLFLLKVSSISDFVGIYSTESYERLDMTLNYTELASKVSIPIQTELSILLEKRNQLPPRNMDLFPDLAKDHIVIVLYVHNRPHYLRIVVDSLSKIDGINETLLVVSHDGYFHEMNKIIEGIDFCQVKQIFAPYSPHVFPDSFPGTSKTDCRDKDDPVKKKCDGTPDQYGNHRSPKIVSLKHHWWWMMNTVWDGLNETKDHSGHVLFIEEDHFIYPNAYRNLVLLTKLKNLKCPDCYAANLAPSDVKSRGERFESLVAERMGNVGYAFNRTVWEKIHRKAKEFCSFDDYNWDITMWSTVYPSFGSPVFTLRGPRTSAVHFGKCGLHQGQDEREACIDKGEVNILVEDIDKSANIKNEWQVQVYRNQPGYKAGFRGWGGWGDTRDRQLCMDFAKMHRRRV